MQEVQMESTTLEKLIKEFRTKFQRQPAWPPGLTDMRPGDVGTIDSSGWTRLHNLRDDFHFEYETSTLATSTKYESSSKYATTTSVAGDVAPGIVANGAINAGLSFDAE